MQGNPYYASPGNDYSQGLSGLSQVIGQIGERKRAEESQQKASEKLAKMKEGAIAARDSGDPERVSDFIINNPEMPKTMVAALNQKFPGKVDAIKQALQTAAIDPTMMKSAFNNLKSSFMEDGKIDPQEQTNLDKFQGFIDSDPETAHKQVLSELYFLSTPDEIKKIKDITKKEEVKTPTSIIGNFFKNNPNATDEEALAFKKKMDEEGAMSGSKSYAPDKLTKLYTELDKLPKDSPRRKAYERAIEKETTNSNPETELVLAQRIVDGKLDFNTLSRRGGQKGRIAAIIAEIAPDFNLIDAQANIKYKTDPGNLKSIALIAGIEPLFEELKGKAKVLNNSLIPIFNKGVNYYKLQKGDAKIVAFNNLRDDVIAETERVLLGTGVLSDSKYLRALHNLNSAQSPPQMAAAIEQMELVVEKREEALRTEPYPQSENKPDPLGIR